MSERLNVKSMLAEPEPKNDRPFDPERDIPQERWVHIQELASAMPPSVLLSIAHCQAVLGRELSLSSVDQAALRELVRKDAREHKWSEFVGHAAELFTVGLGTEISPEQWKEIEKRREEKDSSALVATYLDMLSSMAVLGKKMVLSEERLAGAQEYVHTLAENKHWTIFAKNSARLAILGYKQKITPDEWGALRETLDSFRCDTSDSIYHFVALAYAMAVLSADEITISPTHGLRLVFNTGENLKEEPLPPPSLRKF